MNKTIIKSIAENFQNTELGFLRIKKNLGIIHLSDFETEQHLKKIILSTPIGEIIKKGKNYYFKNISYNSILTVNATSLTIITAKQIEKISSN